MVTCAIAEETGGSIVKPARWASVVGLVPTRELVSADGMIQRGISTRVGPMCRTVQDVARILDVYAGYDPADELTRKQSDRVATRPDMIWQFAQHLEREFAAKGIAGVEVYAFADVSLNGRPLQPIVDSTVDLTKVDWSFFGHASWILPLKEEDGE